MNDLNEDLHKSGTHISIIRHDGDRNGLWDGCVACFPKRISKFFGDTLDRESDGDPLHRVVCYRSYRIVSYRIVCTADPWRGRS